MSWKRNNTNAGKTPASGNTHQPPPPAPSSGAEPLTRFDFYLEDLCYHGLVTLINREAEAKAMADNIALKKAFQRAVARFGQPVTEESSRLVREWVKDRRTEAEQQLAQSAAPAMPAHPHAPMFPVPNSAPPSMPVSGSASSPPTSGAMYYSPPAAATPPSLPPMAMVAPSAPPAEVPAVPSAGASESEPSLKRPREESDASLGKLPMHVGPAPVPAPPAASAPVATPQTVPAATAPPAEAPSAPYGHVPTQPQPHAPPAAAPSYSAIAPHAQWHHPAAMEAPPVGYPSPQGYYMPPAAMQQHYPPAPYGAAMGAPHGMPAVYGTAYGNPTQPPAYPTQPSAYANPYEVPSSGGQQPGAASAPNPPQAGRSDEEERLASPELHVLPHNWLSKQSAIALIEALVKAVSPRAKYAQEIRAAATSVGAAIECFTLYPEECTRVREECSADTKAAAYELANRIITLLCRCRYPYLPLQTVERVVHGCLADQRSRGYYGWQASGYVAAMQSAAQQLGEVDEQKKRTLREVPKGSKVRDNDSDDDERRRAQRKAARRAVPAPPPQNVAFGSGIVGGAASSRYGGVDSYGGGAHYHAPAAAAEPPAEPKPAFKYVRPAE